MASIMRVLALNPFHTGSHKAFIEGWIQHSRHDWTLLTLPGRRWKWRMRHAALTFARMAEVVDDHDIIVTTDMLNVAELRAFLPGDTSILLYMHENQLTYPTTDDTDPERDLHFAFTNIVSAAAADRVWFNSAYHRDTFIDAAEKLVRSMPDHQPLDAIEDIAAKSTVQHPGITPPTSTPTPNEPPLRILWNARWEHDKNPDTFFAALRLLADRNVPFRLDVLGEMFATVPSAFTTARTHLADHIETWGYVEHRADYAAALSRADVVVSTAHHEFFGIAILEAVAAGALPLVPRALTYPETLAAPPTSHDPFHDNTPESVAQRLMQLAATPPDQQDRVRWSQTITDRFAWPNRAATMDDQLEHNR